MDNEALLKNDPGYVNMLNNLSDGLRQAWRDGNWDMMAGQYFTEFNRERHVVEPFHIPEHWKKYRAIDYGLDCCACVWAAVDEHGTYYIYREYAYENKTISEGSGDILSLSENEHILYTVAPPDIWGRSQESGKAKADLFLDAGLSLTKGSANREAGWLAIKELLKSDRIKFFENCTELTDCLTALQRDPARPTDCMSEPHEITHLPDALRYFVLQYITPSKEKKSDKSEMEKYRDKLIRKNRRRRGI